MSKLQTKGKKINLHLCSKQQTDVKNLQMFFLQKFGVTETFFLALRDLFLQQTLSVKLEFRVVDEC